MSNHDLLDCHHCATVQSASAVRCSFCGSELHKHRQFPLQRSWCFILTALVLYFPANLLPIMATSQLGTSSRASIAGGVILLWEHGSYLIAAIIFIASILVPIAKFITLIGLCLSEQFKLYPNPHNKLIVYRMTEFVGRWSMVDVFVVAFLAGLIQMGNLMSIVPGPAALAFAGMVIFTILAANSLDPKLFWEDVNE